MGDSAQLTCHISKGDRPLRVSWTFQGRQVGPEDGVEVLAVNEKTSILTITSASAAHSGNYTCRAQNAAGVTEHSAPVHVNGARTRLPFLRPVRCML
ncbi:cell adhesion molecule Dscam2-like [Frankliniella occidentalis]|uniref:Cell adhesion molecule Dscam2-like n=1 Tax=Frankliniella occidentalis TaxID=133901 RepID=A0A9C6TXH4_FRAOC|nr:cell adhesion molecule Dscam2-like [Frankliniella occidentalis]